MAECRDCFGLRVTRATDDQKPHGVPVEAVHCSGRESGVDGIEVVVSAQPMAERPVQLCQGHGTPLGGHGREGAHCTPPLAVFAFCSRSHCSRSTKS